MYFIPTNLIRFFLGHSPLIKIIFKFHFFRRRKREETVFFLSVNFSWWYECINKVYPPPRFSLKHEHGHRNVSAKTYYFTYDVCYNVCKSN